MPQPPIPEQKHITIPLENVEPTIMMYLAPLLTRVETNLIAHIDNCHQLQQKQQQWSVESVHAHISQCFGQDARMREEQLQEMFLPLITAIQENQEQLSYKAMAQKQKAPLNNSESNQQEEQAHPRADTSVHRQGLQEPEPSKQEEPQDRSKERTTFPMQPAMSELDREEKILPFSSIGEDNGYVKTTRSNSVLLHNCLLQDDRSTRAAGIMERSVTDISPKTPLLRDESVRRDTPLKRKTTTGLPSSLKDLSRRSSHHRMAALFPEVDDLKESVMDSLRRTQFDVEDLYHEVGIWQDIAKDRYFKNIMLFMVFLNSVWIYIETDYDKASEVLKSAVMFQDPWFIFDTSLVVIMVSETWLLAGLYAVTGFDIGAGPARSPQVFRIFRLFRLARVFRATRILEHSPELLTLAWGVFAGIRSVCAVLCLLLLMIYIFGVVFTMVLRDTEVGTGVFDTVPQSMNHLLLQVLCGPDAVFMQALLAFGSTYYFMFLLFLLGSNLTLMNMLIGVVCDVVFTTSEAAKDEIFLRQINNEIARISSELDRDRNGGISQPEFEVIIQDPQMTKTFVNLGVDIVGLANFARFIFEQSDEIPYLDFGRLIYEYRGAKNATVKDMMEMRRYVSLEILSLESRIREYS